MAFYGGVGGGDAANGHNFCPAGFRISVITYIPFRTCSIIYKIFLNVLQITWRFQFARLQSQYCINTYILRVLYSFFHSLLRASAESFVPTLHYISAEFEYFGHPHFERDVVYAGYHYFGYVTLTGVVSHLQF